MFLQACSSLLKKNLGDQSFMPVAHCLFFFIVLLEEKKSVLNTEHASKLPISVTICNRNQTTSNFELNKYYVMFMHIRHISLKTRKKAKKTITKKRICCGKSNQKLHEFIKQPGQTWPKLPGFF